MKHKKNSIAGIHSCYGCGVCAIACPKHIIDIIENEDGFYEPCIVELEKCTHCGLCVSVCSFSHNDVSQDASPVFCGGAWSNETGIRKVSASGGAGFEVGRFLITQGYKAIAVRYNTQEKRAEHYLATTVEEFLPSMGSKYIQSFTLDGFKHLNRKEKFLVTGTPCQIDSLRRYVRKMRCEDNVVLMDFFCHGVPSRHVWLKYLSEQEKVLGDISYVGWRNKLNGWHDSWAMVLDGAKGVGEEIDWHDSYNMLIKEKKGFLNSRWTKGDSFYAMFLGNNCLGKSCYKHCKFKYAHSSADIRIGDMWGKTYQTNEKGVTACVAFTDKGVSILQHMPCEIVQYPFEQTAEGQIRQPIKYPKGWKLVIHLSKMPFVSMKSLVFFSRIVSKINSIFK